MRYHITLVDRVQYFRRPRSKKRRIRRKWRKNPKSWRPNPHIFKTTVMVGSLAGENYLAKAKEDPYFNPETPFSPNIWQMHTKTWEQIIAKIPKFEAMCDVYRPAPFISPSQSSLWVCESTPPGLDPWHPSRPS